jgi:hypothetical protein
MRTSRCGMPVVTDDLVVRGDRSSAKDAGHRHQVTMACVLESRASKVERREKTHKSRVVRVLPSSYDAMTMGYSVEARAQVVGYAGCLSLFPRSAWEHAFGTLGVRPFADARQTCLACSPRRA